jgi:hypothetical protein
LPDLAEAEERGCGQVRRSADRLTHRLEGAWEELPAKGKQAFPAVASERVTAIPMSLATADLPIMRRMS